MLPGLSHTLPCHWSLISIGYNRAIYGYFRSDQFCSQALFMQTRQRAIAGKTEPRDLSESFCLILLKAVLKYNSRRCGMVTSGLG
jgi:hypothetical protein